VVFREAVEFGHCGSGALAVSVVPFVAGGFGEEEDSRPEHYSPDEADCHGDSVGTGVGTTFSAVVYAVCRENSDCDE
jgi:hypothetical protein